MVPSRTGTQLVAFIANRQDGARHLRAGVLYFIRLKQMVSEYLTLWNVFIENVAWRTKGIEKALNRRYCSEPPSKNIVNFPQLSWGKKPKPFPDRHEGRRAELVLEDITRSHELEEKFLEECYSQSGALSQYALVSRDILQARYASLFEEGQKEGPNSLLLR
jgi:hypothetical protein